MALITDLPAAANIGTSDYILIDTGSENKKLQISSFYADASHPGLVSNTLQDFGGYKYFAQTSANAAAIGFKFTDKSNGIYGQIIQGYGNGSPQMQFRQMSVDSSGNALTYYDSYRLPVAGVNKSSNDTYYILTTKSVTLNQTDKDNALASLGIHKTILSAAKTITVPNNYRGLLIITNTTANDNGMYIITTTGTGVLITKAISAASNITIDTSTANSLKLTPSSGTRTICLIDISGASTGW